MNTLLVKNGAGASSYQAKIGDGLTSGDPQYVLNEDFLRQVKQGNIPGKRIVNKFGYGEVNSTMVPITSSGTYQTPSSDVALQISSTSTDDTAAGTGARKVAVEGLTIAGLEVVQEITLNGTTAVAIATSLCRVFRIRVTETGSYASSSVSSNAGVIAVTDAATGTDNWGQIEIGFAQSQIGIFSTTSTETATLLGFSVDIESSKTVDLFMFKREGLTTITAPFTPRRLLREVHGVGGQFSSYPPAPVEYFPPSTDFGFMALSAAASSVTVSMQILLEEV